MHGLVIRNTGSWYTVLADDGTTWEARAKGNFRLRGIRSTNPVAIGDGVTFHAVESEALITDIDDRKNYVIRRATNLSKQSHILAANVDQCFLIVTLCQPETSTTFIDRFLASAEAYRIPVVLVFNKTDLLTSEDDRDFLSAMCRLYETVGYECLCVSAETGEGVDALRERLKGCITLLSGNSGVGKSTIINRLVPGVNLKTAELSDAHDAGQHTTTFSEMIEIEAPLSSHEGDTNVQQGNEAPSGAVGGASPSYLIDTPGIKGFGTFDMEPEEITSYFREIFHFSKDCRFSNCTHTHEPGCAVLQALADHYIAQSRYQSYLSMLQDKDESKYREAY